MSYSSGDNGTSTTENNNKYKGVRRRKWGKWVSEVRVPGMQERLWLGTYASLEAAAMAHDVAFYCLRRPTSLEKLNFPEMLPSCCVQQRKMSPRSVQTMASDAGMAVDGQSIAAAAAAGKTSMVAASYDEKEKTDYHVDRHINSNVREGPCEKDGFWWDGEGHDGGTWQRREGYREGEASSISIDDYFNF